MDLFSIRTNVNWTLNSQPLQNLRINCHCTLSDHNLIGITLNLRKPTTSIYNSITRSLLHYSTEALLSKLSNSKLPSHSSPDTFNEDVSSFTNTFTHILDEIAPKCVEMQHVGKRNAPWLTPHISRI